MNFSSKIFITLFVSFILLITSLVLSYQSISNNNLMLKSLEQEQIKLLHFANKLNHDIEANQANALQSILLKDKSYTNNTETHFENFSTLINQLEELIKNSTLHSKKLSTIIYTIKKRIVAYQAVQTSLIDAINSNDIDDIQDAVIGFNAITVKFSEDINNLIDISNNKLHNNLLELKYSNEQSSSMLIISFLIAFLLISISAYKFNNLTKTISKELKRAENAEQEQKRLQSQLLKYNDDLEEEISQKTKELHERLYTNFLSGLRNRNKLIEDNSLYNFQQMALLNIDKFQKFNDVYGEEVGNIAISMSAEFLAQYFQHKEGTLYHLSGDEFVVAVKDSHHIDNKAFINDIESFLIQYENENFFYDGKTFNLNMSAGLSFNGNKKMLAYADMALKDAKQKNQSISIFQDNKKLEKIHKSDIECHKKLLKALETNNILSYFQPLLPLQDTTKATKYESLVRLKDEKGHIIPPFNFINVAKSTRIYNRLTHTIVNNTLEVIKKHQLPCSLNISMDDIENSQTLEFLYQTFDMFEYNHLLTIELLETEEFKDYKAVFDFCIKVRSYGIKIALDDFGSGYSNFSHILNLPVDYIKIDASLISNIDRDNQSRLMVETIVGLAEKLHVETIAEFVASKEILDIVTKIGVDYAQGYHVGKPEPIEKYINT